ncbi:hypothetical protein ATCC90586_007400 [Pythium insidiosum]|nr:hypothetical protein ATCC90586_007400 [Pythium insidiosum]
MDPEYDSANLFRELIETMLLTIQAYRASYLVPRPWINNTLVLRARLLGLMVNTLLDVVYYIVVPSVLFLPYYNEFDASWAGFKPSCWFSTRWLISAITEWQMLFVTSIWDAASKLFIALSIYRALLTLRPWFARRATCSLMILDCRPDVGNIQTGSAAEFDHALTAIDKRWLASLTIRHCPHVEITPQFLQLNALMGFKIFNSTLVRWDSDAAFSRHHHLQMKVVHVLQTSMAALPRGLYGRDFPPWLQDVEILECNVTDLPLGVVDAWSDVMLLKLEGLAFVGFPEALTLLRPTFLALTLNGITRVPREVMENPKLQGLSICANPFSELPSDVQVLPPLTYLLIAMTNVSYLPSWLDVSTLWGSASLTPLCELLLTDPDRLADDPRLPDLQQNFYCGPLDDDPRWLYQYPLLAEPFFNPLARRVILSNVVTVWSSLDIMDRNYDTTNAFREVIETTFLTHQAYRASYLVARPWINNTLVTLLVLNCWSVQLVHYFFGRKVLRARLIGLMINTVLDVVYYIVVPTVLFLPYYADFDVRWHGFGPDLWFSTRWLVRAITEWQMLFVTSAWDAVSKLVIALSISRSLLTSACSLMILDCRPDVGNIQTGSAAEFDHALTAIDKRWLASLTIRHCPHVEITPQFLQLNALMGFKIFNSTLVRWDSDAAFSRHHHLQMKVVHVLQTSMAALPRGLYGRDFPPWLQDVEILECNVTDLPLGVVDAWSDVMLLKLEGLAFVGFPEALTLLRPTFLALALSGITRLPREVMENPRLRSLMLSANPVSDLPEDVRVSPPLEVLLLDMTNVSVLPSWMDVSQLVGSASLAPLCQALQTGSGRASADPRLPRLRRAFYCGPIPSDPRYLYQYPLLLEPRLNP